MHRRCCTLFATTSFQKRTPPPDTTLSSEIIDEDLLLLHRTADCSFSQPLFPPVPPDETTSAKTETSHQDENHKNHSPTRTTTRISKQCADAIRLLTCIPRDGMLVTKLAFQSGMSISDFACAMRFVREHCFPIVNLHRISTQSYERVGWVEVARGDEKRLSLDAVKAVLQQMMASCSSHKKNENDKNKKDSTVASREENSENKTASSTSEGDQHRHDDDDDNDDDDTTGVCGNADCSAAAELANELITSLRRELYQEKAARLAEERRANEAHQLLRRVLRSLAVVKLSSNRGGGRRHTT